MPGLRVFLALTALVLAVSGVLASAGGDEVPPGSPVGAEPARTRLPVLTAAGRAVRLLDEWQAARSRAYSSGDVGALRRLYLPGSRAGERDVAVLQQYAERGVRVDLTVRTDRVAVLVARPRLVVVRHRSQVLAVAGAGAERRRLPVASAQWRRTTLRLVDGRWRLSAALRDSDGSPREPP